MGEHKRKLSIGFWAFRVAADYRIALEKYSRTLDLGAQDVYLLIALHRLGPSSLVELARDQETPHPSIVRQVDALENRGYAQRSPHPEDRRIKVVSLTPKGMELIPTLHEWFNKLSEESTAGLSPEELVVIRQGLERVHRNLCPASCRHGERKMFLLDKEEADNK